MIQGKYQLLKFYDRNISFPIYKILYHRYKASYFIQYLHNNFRMRTLEEEAHIVYLYKKKIYTLP